MPSLLLKKLFGKPLKISKSAALHEQNTTLQKQTAQIWKRP
jgi:hypothetical protein